LRRQCDQLTLKRGAIKDDARLLAPIPRQFHLGDSGRSRLMVESLAIMGCT